MKRCTDNKNSGRLHRLRGPGERRAENEIDSTIDEEQLARVLA